MKGIKFKDSGNTFGYYVRSRELIQCNIEIQIDIVNGVITNKVSNKFTHIRETMMRLLVFLIENADEPLISNKNIMVNVWDIYDLRSSNSRLWQVMKLLQQKLNSINIPSEFIKHVENKGYVLSNVDVTRLFYERNIFKDSAQ